MKSLRPHILVVIALAIVLSCGWHGALRNALTDLRFAWQQRQASGDVVVVAIDAPSIERIGVWPWPRQLHAQLLRQLEIAGVRDIAFEATSLGPASPVGYVFASPLAPVQRPVTEYASASFPPSAGVIVGAVDLMHRIRTEFKYDPKATVISTPLKEVFEKRHGVCQDFAHVMIAGLRGLGLPAAYVSGYLRTIPPPGKPRLQGADATHAWVSLWCGEEIGWVGFDPTNDILVANDHIVLAIGRDFSDVSPVDGIIVGSRKQKLAVAVDVLLVE